MKKRMQFVKVPAADFFREVLCLGSDEERVRFLESFARDIFLQEGMTNAIAIACVNEAREAYQRYSDAGRRGAEKRWENSDANGDVNGDVIGDANGDANGDAYSNNQLSGIRNQESAISKDSIAQKFERKKIPFESFWSIYPVKKGKKRALVTWQRMADAERQAAIDAIPAYLASTDPDFRKHGSTYLNDKVWLDDLSPLQKTNGASKSFKQIDKENSNKAWDDLIASAEAELAKLPTADELVERYRQR